MAEKNASLGTVGTVRKKQIWPLIYFIILIPVHILSCLQGKINVYFNELL